MTRRFLTGLMAIFMLAVSIGPVRAAGFELVRLATSPPMNVGIWYPTDAAAPQRPNTPFRQALAINSAPTGTRLPLIVLSHGNGGWMGGHADTALALAEAGFVAVAPTHPGINGRDAAAPPSHWMIARPQDVRVVIDFMMTDWDHAAVLSQPDVGVFGFSAGAYTALVVAGAVPDTGLMATHCATRPQEYVCRIGLVAEATHGLPADAATAPAYDRRIKAISIAAPAFGFSFGRSGLEKIRTPVQIFAGTEDHLVPHDTNAAPLIANLPTEPQVELVNGAGHAAFLVPCDPALEKTNPAIWQEICVDPPAFDRAAFHVDMNARIVEFFRAVFGPIQ